MRDILGGFNPKDDLPFLDVTDTDRAFWMATEHLSTKLSNKYEKYFKDTYGFHYAALELLKKRFIFYIKTLQNDQELLGKHKKEMGGLWFTERIVFAIYGCITKGEEIKEKMNNLIESFSSHCRKQENKFHAPEEPFSNCEKLGVCICDIGQKEPYMYGCIINDPSMLRRDEKTSFKRFKEGCEKMSKMLLSEHK